MLPSIYAKTIHVLITLILLSMLLSRANFFFFFCPLRLSLVQLIAISQTSSGIALVMAVNHDCDDDI
jgi:hypothetical protein